MKFTFIGDKDGDAADAVVFFDITFQKGKPVYVDDEFICKKLAGNSHFKRGRKRKHKHSNEVAPSRPSSLINKVKSWLT